MKYFKPKISKYKVNIMNILLYQFLFQYQFCIEGWSVFIMSYLICPLFSVWMQTASADKSVSCLRKASWDWREREWELNKCKKCVSVSRGLRLNAFGIIQRKSPATHTHSLQLSYLIYIRHLWRNKQLKFIQRLKRSKNMQFLKYWYW